MGTTIRLRHIDSLDGLRGIAILLVFLVHYLPRRAHTLSALVANFGWTGVDLFLVLSGFLITGILYDSIEAKNFFKVFYMRRALRLFPLYFAAVMTILLVTHGLRGQRTWGELPFFVYGANIMNAISLDTAVFRPYLVCTHFWSLALEEQFYSVWPFVVFLCRGPRRRETLIRICLCGMAIAPLCRVLAALSGASPHVAYEELPMRMDSLLLGSLIALISRGGHDQVWLSARRLYGLLTGCVLLFAAAAYKAGTLDWASLPMSTAGYSAVAGISGCLLALALLPETLPHRIGRIGVLRFFGRYSYGLYVWHFMPYPITSMWVVPFRSRIHPQGLADVLYTGAMLGLFTLVAVISFNLFEVHFLKLKSHFKYRYEARVAEGELERTERA